MSLRWPATFFGRWLNQGPSPLQRAGVAICVVANDAAYAQGLAKAIKQSARRSSAGGGMTPGFVSRSEADICIYAFHDSDFSGAALRDDHARAIASDPAALKIFLETPSSAPSGPQLVLAQDRNATIAGIANGAAGYVVPLMSKFLRWGPTRLMESSGIPNDKGYVAIANALAKQIDQFVVRKGLRGPATPESSSASQQPAGFALDQIGWNGPIPSMLKVACDLRVVTDFLDGQISFHSFPGWGRVPLTLPIDWSMAGPNRSWRSYFLGLEFISGIFVYCHAHMLDADRYADVTEELKRRKIGVEELLARTGAVIADFVRHNPPDASSASRAWHEGTVCRRLRTLLAYLLSAKQASLKGIRCDPDQVAAAHAGMVDCVEFLRSGSAYVKAGNHGVRQDSFLILADLLMGHGAEAKARLKEDLDRLIRYQLDLALAPDGVWRENSFGYHCMVMSMLADLASTLRDAGEDITPLRNAVGRMCTFVEALIKIDGVGPLIGDTEPRRYLHALAVGRELAGATEPARPQSEATPTDVSGFVRGKDTYFFPDGGYFATHSSTSPDPVGSSVIFFANLSTPKHKQSDDLSVLFTHGATDLLIDGGAYNKETGDEVRNAARFDPASHNTYRVNGVGYSLRSVRSQRLAGIDRVWQGDGWAAAEGFNAAYPDGAIRRLVIHLKRDCALLIVDRLKSNGASAATFEQFWHVAPQFASASNGASSIAFVSPLDGALLMAFDAGDAALSVEHGSESDALAWLMMGDEKVVPTPYVRRSKTSANEVMATAFQWVGRPDALAISVARNGSDGLDIRASGANFSCHFQADENGVRLVGR